MSGKIDIVFLLALLGSSLMAQASGDRQRPLLGGYQPMDASSPVVQDVARKATVQLEEERNSMKAYRFLRVISANKQIVAGTNYKLQLLIGQTACNRGAKVSVANCPIEKIQICSVIIYVPLQSRSQQLTSQICGREKAIARKTTTRIPMPGGVTEIDVSSDEVKQAASFATQQLSSQSNGGYQVQSQRIIKATSQIVAGVKYTLTMEVSLTFSKTNQKKTTQCEVDVWDQPWRNPRYILQQYKCNKFIT